MSGNEWMVGLLLSASPGKIPQGLRLDRIEEEDPANLCLACL